MKKITTAYVGIATLIGFSSLGGGAVAQPSSADSVSNYPDRPVTIVSWSPAGGPIDILARTIAHGLSELWNEKVLVENRTGATGVIATQHAARATPDGYTLLITTSTAHIANLYLQPSLSYNPKTDFEPVARLAAGSVVLMAPANAPFNDIDGLIKYAREQGKEISYGTWGIGSSAHLYGELLKTRYNVPLVHVPYRGDVGSTQDLVGGTLPISFTGGVTAKRLIDAGQAKALAIASAQRFSALPNVPTFKEQGYEGFDLMGWAGIFVPAGTPQPIIEKLSKDLEKVVKSPEVSKRLLDIGQDEIYMDHAAMKVWLESEFENWGKLIKDSGVDKLVEKK